MTQSFNSIAKALDGISSVSNGETINVAEENLTEDAKKGIITLMELAAKRHIEVVK